VKNKSPIYGIFSHVTFAKGDSSKRCERKRIDRTIGVRHSRERDRIISLKDEAWGKLLDGGRFQWNFIAT